MTAARDRFVALPRDHILQVEASVALELLVLRDFDLEGMDAALQQAAAVAETHWLADAVQQAFGKRLADYAAVRHNRDLLLLGEGERGESIDSAMAHAKWVRDAAFAPPLSAAALGQP